MARKKQWDRSEEFLTCWQTARLLNCCEEHIFRSLKRGAIRGIRIGRIWRIPRAQFDVILSEGEAGGGAQGSAVGTVQCHDVRLDGGPTS